MKNSLNLFNQKIMISTLALLIPSIHLGANEYLSVSFFIFITTLTYSTIDHTGKLSWAFIKLSLPLLMFSLLKAIYDNDTQSLLINFREILVMTLLLTVFTISKDFKIKNLNIVTFTTLLVTLLTILQVLDIYFKIGNGIFFLPENLYSLNYGTLSVNLYEKFEQVGRPSAFFSEPSSLGAFGLSVFFIGNERKTNYLTLLGAFLVVLSGSFSSIIGLVFLFFSFAHTMPKKYIAFILLFILFGFVYLTQRIFTIFAGDDQSTLQRLIFPFQVLISSGGFFGIDKSTAISSASVLGASTNIFDSYFLGKSITNGVYVLILIPLLFKYFNIQFFLLIIIMGFINGEPFYYDRLALLSFVAIFSYSKIIQNVKK